MRKLRFATAVPEFSRKRGGAERYLVDLCTRMADEGHEVHVYAERWEEEDRRLHLHRVNTIPFPKSLRLLSFAKKATKTMDRGNYDVTLGVGNTLRADVLQPHGGVHWAWFWRSLRLYDNRLVWTTKFLGRILSPKQWVSGWIEDGPYKKGSFSRIIAISDMVRQDLIRWYGIPEDRISVIYNGVDIERFHPRNRKYREEIRKRHNIGDEIVILFVSNNFRMKGLGYLLEALALIKKKDYLPFKLLILGRDRTGPYERLAEKMGIFEKIVFAGSTGEPEKYYGAADLLVHPTFYDACSLVVLEALASGLPVITSQCNGASGVLGNGQKGFVIPNAREAKVLSEKILFLFDEEKRRKASLDARACMERFPSEANFNQMMTAFLEVTKVKEDLSENRSKA